jgi:hypothetical protein
MIMNLNKRGNKRRLQMPRMPAIKKNQGESMKNACSLVMSEHGILLASVMMCKAENA